MSQVKAEFSGGIVAEPETKQVGQNSVLEFPVYVNHTRKNRDTGEYEPTGDTTKIRVSLWGDAAATDLRKGDIVEVKGSIVEKTFTKRDGTEGRALQTSFVESCVVKFRRDDAAPAPSGGFGGGAGFGGDDTPPAF